MKKSTFQAGAEADAINSQAAIVMIADDIVSFGFTRDASANEVERARDYLSPYVLSPYCRLEVLCDMKRAAADCRRQFSLYKDPYEALILALLELCPDATSAELDAVLNAAEAELNRKIERLEGAGALGLTADVETWLELAKGRTEDISNAQGNVERVLARRTSLGEGLTYNGAGISPSPSRVVALQERNNAPPPRPGNS